MAWDLCQKRLAQNGFCHDHRRIGQQVKPLRWTKFIDRIHQDPQVMVNQLWLRFDLDREEEKSQFSDWDQLKGCLGWPFCGILWRDHVVVTWPVRNSRRIGQPEGLEGQILTIFKKNLRRSENPIFRRPILISHCICIAFVLGTSKIDVTLCCVCEKKCHRYSCDPLLKRISNLYSWSCTSDLCLPWPCACHGNCTVAKNR